MYDSTADKIFPPMPVENEKLPEWCQVVRRGDAVQDPTRQNVVLYKTQPNFTALATDQVKIRVQGFVSTWEGRVLGNWNGCVIGCLCI